MKTTAMRRTVGTGAAALVAISIALVMAFSALAAEGLSVYGVDNNDLQDGKVGILSVAGTAGDTVYVDINDASGEPVAWGLPTKLDSEVGTVFIDGMSAADVAGMAGYEIIAHTEAKGGDTLYTGTIYPVYARFTDGADDMVIGIRTVNPDSAADQGRVFTPQPSLFTDGANYRLSSSTPDKEGSKYFYTYKPYKVEGTATGTVTYVDEKGNELVKYDYPGIGNGYSRNVAILPGVVGEDGKAYRSVYYTSKVTLSNPGQLSYVIPCRSAEQLPIPASWYVANIRFVDDSSHVIAQDSVAVEGEFFYTVPTKIYQQLNGQYVEYELVKPQPLVNENGAVDLSIRQTDPYDVKYKKNESKTSTKVTFKCWGNKDKTQTLLETQEFTVDAKNKTAEPPASITDAEGAVWEIAGGDASKYAYTFGDARSNLIDVYYVPEGQKASEDPYDVMIKYVNLVDDSVIKTETVTVTNEKDSNAEGFPIAIPATFTQDGKDYVRLDGQADTIYHNYYSNPDPAGTVPVYTVYYRGADQTLPDGITVTRVIVVYEDVVVAGGTQASTNAAPLPADTGLNSITTPDGGLITDDEGTDSETIRDESTPLDQGGQSADSQTDWLPIAGGLGVLAVAAIAAYVLLRNRKGADGAK